jgi:hypothetical protein
MIIMKKIIIADHDDFPFSDGFLRFFLSPENDDEDDDEQEREDEEELLLFLTVSLESSLEGVLVLELSAI